MSVIRLISVDKSAGGRIYATDMKGTALFPRTAALGETLKKGQFANVIQQEQTKTTNDEGQLVDLDHPVMRPIITAVFETREAAIEAAAEDKIFDLETDLYAKSQVGKLAEKYSVDPKTLAATI